MRGERRLDALGVEGDAVAEEVRTLVEAVGAQLVVELRVVHGQHEQLHDILLAGELLFFKN